ncbi:serpin 100A [Cochliomyia hominivorax]
MNFLQASLVLLSLGFITALPTKSEEAETSYASKASQIIATNLLKSYNDIDGNQVHSPLGVTTMLAILAEATQGDTYNEFYKVLGYPKERSALRDSFKSILSKYQTKILGSEPSFQTWLYIYRNFTAREEFKNLVRDNYYVDVKDISRDELDSFEADKFLSLNGTTNNSKDVIGFETLKRLKVDDDDEEDDVNDDIQNDDEDDTHKVAVTTVGSYTDSYGEEFIEKETSKFDRFVDDKQYVEKPQIIEEIKKAQQQQQKQKEEIADVAAAASQTKATIESTEKLENLDEKPVADATSSGNSNNDVQDQNKREDDLNLEENETVQENEKLLKNYKEATVGEEQETEDVEPAAKVLIPIQEVLESNEPEKVTLPLQKLENVLDEASKGSQPAEIMLALESHVSTARSAFGGRSLFRRDDISSALSANSITGRDVGSKTKMLLFNGLYFRGNWATEFKEEREIDEFFFMTSEDAMKTPMMHARGKFYMAEMPELNAKLICLPYENLKYSLMILLPNDLEGLHSVIAKLEPSDLKMAKTEMKEEDLHIVLPKFQIEETSRSESMLKGLGLTKLFSRNDADLSLLSEDRDLHVDEIVQFVNVKVDEGGSSNIALSASDTQARDNETFEKIEINHPFAYFVMDCEQDFVLVSGKVHAPEVQEELPLGIEIEFEKV